MSEIHPLSDKEIKALSDASSLFKKLASYVERVNTTNTLLNKNLEERIKAGDVTNAQKVALSCAEDVEKLYNATLKDIWAECKKSNPGCKCEPDRHDSCPIYQKKIVAIWMYDASKGIDSGWDNILEYALIGRKEWVRQHHPNKENSVWK